ncbi:hypothetical protein ELQ35_14115 [Peribacillus cavernae]|uniref:Uncharacterized protein n=1 Tax=Peribacillus cavernae TaxID=1674310 RepID=A0A433HIF4_9BACI|nr:hypothetical protein [Peribacillus cavernae]MDQ0220458.1 hypothetical protein [Peribacillus cavernae]RUQ28039.1 hypothetical protein ELQ35_14115 [Peribacillus cavernae]
MAFRPNTLMFFIGWKYIHFLSCFKNMKGQTLPDESLAQLLLVFETMAKAAEQGRQPIIKKRPGFKRISEDTKGDHFPQIALQLSPDHAG